MSWNVGSRVRHTVRPEWGQGEVLQVGQGGKLVVYFSAEGEVVLKNDFVTAVSPQEAKMPLRVPRRREKDAPPLVRTMGEYTKAFMEDFPKGFSDPAYLDQERNYKLAARDLLVTSLSKKEFEKLLSGGHHADVCRRARAVINKTNLVYPNERMKLNDGLKDSAAQRRFSTSLYELLHGGGPFEARFTSFSDVLSQLGAAKWTIATYFPFLAAPKEHCFLKPVLTQRIADASQVELNYRSELNWLTYTCLLRLANLLLEDLKSLKPKDMIDAQSFMWCVARNS